MRIWTFTFKNEAMWIVLFSLALIVLGVLGLLVVRLLMGIR
jgi:hypothetical protein